MLVLVVASSTSVSLSQGKQYKGSVLFSPVGTDTAVRFFYEPRGGDVTLGPLVIRAVVQNDARLNTVDRTATEGPTAFVSFEEMSDLLKALAQANLSWKESKKVKALESYKGLDPSDDPSVELNIEVLDSRGTSRTNVGATAMCKTLAAWDATITAPRALLEFQHYRNFWGCEVPGFRFFEYQAVIERENAARRNEALPK